MPPYLHDEMRFPDIIKMAEEYEVANKGIESKELSKPATRN